MPDYEYDTSKLETPTIALNKAEYDGLIADNAALRAQVARMREALEMWREGYMYATREQLGMGVNHYMDKADELSKSALAAGGGDVVL